jgi:hypothetical protein
VETYINYEGEKISFALPASWDVISQTDKPPVAGVNDRQELKTSRAPAWRLSSFSMISNAPHRPTSHCRRS